MVIHTALDVRPAVGVPRSRNSTPGRCGASGYGASGRLNAAVGPVWYVKLTISHPCCPSESASSRIFSKPSGPAWYANLYSYFWGYQLPSESNHQPGPGEGLLMAGV